MRDHPCAHCGEELPPGKWGRHAKYCDRACRSAAERTRNRFVQNGTSRTKGTTGASSELYAASILMLHGWDVYRALSPNSLADLVAVKGEITLRIEVKTRSYYITVSGVKTPQDPQIDADGKFDVLARVNVLAGEIAWETPEGASWHPEFDVAEPAVG